MVQMAKSAKYFELFLRRSPGTVRVSTENSKDKVILVRCSIFRPATAEFRLTGETVADQISTNSTIGSYHIKLLRKTPIVKPVSVMTFSLFLHADLWRMCTDPNFGN